MRYRDNPHVIPTHQPPSRLKLILGLTTLLALLGSNFYLAIHFDQLLALIQSHWLQLKTWWVTTGWNSLKYPLAAIAAIGIFILLLTDR